MVQSGNIFAIVNGMSNLDPEEPDDEYREEDDDESDLRRRTFLERNDWIPWLAAAIFVGAAAAWLQGYLGWP